MTHTIFYILGAIAVLTASLCILSRSALTAVLWLVGTMLSLAGIYVILNAEFVAAIQVLVYAGAVMVLFLFVIMLLNVGGSQSDVRGPPTVAATVVVVGLLAAELFALWQYTPARLARELAQGPEFADPRLAFPNALVAGSAANGNIVRDVAGPLFETYLIPFEVTSILLLAAIVGAVVLAKRKI
jgi:NADH-quinone oxidoreductase subunit J